ncbi:MAG: gliding motility-associated C-terminal domain-containing protein, partial [Cytophagales bacterium]|nr:gliding motility-associated C-terminal domain-containing protein [Cytophagales bacterium]
RVNNISVFQFSGSLAGSTISAWTGSLGPTDSLDVYHYNSAGSGYARLNFLPSAPIRGFVSGLNIPVCAGANVGTLTLTGFLGFIQYWESSTNNFLTTTTITNTSFLLPFANLTTTTGFRAVISNGLGTQTTSSIFTVTVAGIPSGGSVSGINSSLCSGANSSTLTLSGFVGNINHWEASRDNFITSSFITNTTPSFTFNNLTTTTSFRAIVQRGSCGTVTSSAFTVTVNGISVGGTISGANTPVCSGINSGTLTLAGFVGSIQRWESSTDLFVTSTTISNSNNFLTYANLSLPTSYRAIVQNGSCSPVASTAFTIPVQGISIGGSLVGPSNPFCPSINGGILSVSGFSGSVQNWESSSDNFTTSVSINNPFDFYQFSNIASTTSFRAKIQNGVCPSVYSLPYTLTILGISTGGAVLGPLNPVCSSSNSGTLTLSGYSGFIDHWESSNDNFQNFSIIAISGDNFTFSNLSSTTSFRAIVQNGPCIPLTSSSYTVTVNGISLGGVINGSNSPVCSGSSAGTLTLSGYTGTIQQWESSTDNFTTTTTLPISSSYFPVPNLSTATGFRALVQSGTCPPAYSTIAIIPILPSAVGGTITGVSGPFCPGSNSGTLVLNGAVGSITGWESSLDNFTSNSTALPQNAPTLDFNNLTQSTSYRAKVQIGNCPSATSNIFVVNITPSNGGILTGPTTAFCATSNSGTLSVTGNQSPVKRWEFSSDTQNYSPIQNTSDVYSFSQLSTTTSFRVISQSSGCYESVSNIFTITVSSPPVPGYITGESPIGDGHNSGNLILNEYVGNIVQWEKSTDSLMSTKTILQNSSSSLPYSNIAEPTYFRALVSSPGCPSVYSKVVGFQLVELKVFTGFSPNSDGKNDVWKIQNIQYYPDNKVKIFNRWGNLVYQESGYDNVNKVWTGNSNTGFSVGGNELPKGTYYYTISIAGKPDLVGYILLK